ncbi:AAA family ATPase [Nonomuraea thailandensis]
MLVGRRSELALLRSVIGSPPSLALVEGEAGIGKSRLVAELFAAPDLAGTRRLVGQCEQLQEPLPLSPLLDAFRSAGAELARSRLPLNPVAGALAPLLPEIAEHLPPPLPPLPDQRAERHRVFRAAVALLDHLGPLVLVLEDVHWADAGTHDFLAFLAAHRPRDVAVILTVRTEAGLLPIREAFARAPSGPARTISLAPLSLPEVEELAGGVLGVELPARSPAPSTRRRAASRSSWRRCCARCWSGCPPARSPAAPTCWPTWPSPPCCGTWCCSACPPSTTPLRRSWAPRPSSA